MLVRNSSDMASLVKTAPQSIYQYAQKDDAGGRCEDNASRLSYLRRAVGDEELADIVIRLTNGATRWIQFESDHVHSSPVRGDGALMILSTI
jgi:hypothetical protein